MEPVRESQLELGYSDLMESTTIGIRLFAASSLVDPVDDLISRPILNAVEEHGTGA